MSQQQDPIVVCGAPRSGTTYLRRILNTHPQIYISNEIRLFTWVHQSLNVITKKRDVLLNQRDEFVDHLRSVYPDIIREFYRKRWPHALHWGDKNPHYTDKQNRNCLEVLTELFPGARFVHVMRDGRDVVSSLLRKKHENGKPWTSFEGAHTMWMENTDIAAEFGRSLPRGRYVEVRYEELVADDVGVAKLLFESLEIPFHSAVLDFCRAQQESRTPFSGPTRDLTVGADQSDWQSFLDPSRRLRSLELLGSHLVKYAYETDESLLQLTRTLRANEEQF